MNKEFQFTKAGHLDLTKYYKKSKSTKLKLINS